MTIFCCPGGLHIRQRKGEVWDDSNFCKRVQRKSMHKSWASTDRDSVPAGVIGSGSLPKGFRASKHQEERARTLQSPRPWQNSRSHLTRSNWDSQLAWGLKQVKVTAGKHRWVGGAAAAPSPPLQPLPNIIWPLTSPSSSWSLPLGSLTAQGLSTRTSIYWKQTSLHCSIRMLVISLFLTYILICLLGLHFLLWKIRGLFYICKSLSSSDVCLLSSL